jgi:hypothetical protein
MIVANYISVTVPFVLGGCETWNFLIILNEYRLNIFVKISGIFQSRNDSVGYKEKLKCLGCAAYNGETELLVAC